MQIGDSLLRKYFFLAAGMIEIKKEQMNADTAY
jgi:hypothetical protein